MSNSVNMSTLSKVMIEYSHPLYKIFSIVESYGNMNKYGNIYTDTTDLKQSYD